MRIHYLQHVPFEDLANIENWAIDRGHSITCTMLFKDTSFPAMDEFDWLVIMGGPMNIYEDEKYPWLSCEKRFIREAIDSRKVVLGVCLGAQLIADVLGAKVTKGEHKEIGWFPVSLTKSAGKSPAFGMMPEKFIAFHWHGDTFSIPPGCTRMAETQACSNQAFEYECRVFGLQFHLESSDASIGRLVENCGDEVVEGRYIQGAGEMLAQEDKLLEVKDILYLLLDTIESSSTIKFPAPVE